MRPLFRSSKICKIVAKRERFIFLNAPSTIQQKATLCLVRTSLACQSLYRKTNASVVDLDTQVAGSGEYYSAIPRCSIGEQGVYSLYARGYSYIIVQTWPFVICKRKQAF